MENKKPYITPNPLDPEIIKAGKEFQKINEVVRSETERDLEIVKNLILEEEKYISSLEKQIEVINGEVRFDAEEAEIEWEDLHANLKDAKENYAELLQLKKRIEDLLAEAILSKIEVTVNLTEIEKEIGDFKKKLLKNTDNN